jgi:hypothetical protein
VVAIFKFICLNLLGETEYGASNLVTTTTNRGKNSWAGPSEPPQSFFYDGLQSKKLDTPIVPEEHGQC